MRKKVRRTETFLVADNDKTTMPASPTRLYDPTTLALNITKGQLGIMGVSPQSSVAPYTFIDTTPTVSEYPVIQLVQGLDVNQPYPLGKRTVEYSAPIEVNNIESVIRLNYALGAHDVWAVASITPASSIVAKDDAVYQLTVSFTGREIEYFAGCEQAHMLTVEVRTPNFSALATPNPVDWIVKHIVYNVNAESKAFGVPKEHGAHPVVAFAVTDGTTGGVEISTLAANSVVPVFIYGTTTQSIVLTEEMAQSLKDAATASGFTRILNTDLATAGNSTPNAKGILLMALDRDQAFDDRILQTKNYIRVGLPYGFGSNLLSRKVVFGHEGRGYGLQYYKLYEKTHGQRRYSQSHDLWPVVKFPNPVDKNGKYTVFTINHYKVDPFGHSSMAVQPMVEYVLVPHLDNTNAANPLITTLTSRFDSLLTSAGKPSVVVYVP